MKRALQAALCAVPFICLLQLAALAQPTSPSADLLVLSKDARGVITRTTLGLTLKPNPECDQTQQLIPDQSRLVSEQFTLNADNNGLGTFQGLAQVVTPEGRVVLQGWLRGTVGVNTRCGANRQCRLPWHFEGLFEAIPSAFTRYVGRSDGRPDNRPQVVMLNFSADLDPRTAGPLPTYDARLDGLISPPSPITERVTIMPDKSLYKPGEPINAIIANSADQTITAFDLKSYCTIVQLQIQQGNQWTDVAPCLLRRAQLPTRIFSGQKHQVTLPPDDQKPLPEPGTYRLALTFQLGEGGFGTSDQFVITSQPFRIAPAPITEQVTITPDKASYRVGELITAIIANNSEQTITAFDQQTYCTIVQLQIQEGDQWSKYSVCPLNRQPLPTSIQPGQKLEVKLDPQPPSPNPFPPGPGTYRLALIFHLGDVELATGDRFVVISQPFRVVPAQPPSPATVTTERDSYDVRDVIVVKVSNNHDRTIVTADHKSYCSIVDLQRQEGSVWVNIAPCLLASPTRFIPIEAHREYELKLPPENTAAGRVPGVYRIEFIYYLVDSAGRPTGEPVTIYSPLFKLTGRE